jgi:uncharacterized protein YjbJ (UPF0337 family)
VNNNQVGGATKEVKGALKDGAVKLTTSRRP